MIPEAYERTLSEGGKLKLRALARLAFGDDASRFQAAVMLHDAVRAEQRALTLLPAPDPATRLRFAIERCGCLLDGLDPLEASRAWGEVLVASESVADTVASAMRARIDPKYVREEQAFGALLRQHQFVVAEGTFVSAVTMPRGKVRKGLAALIKAYPGVADLWFAQCREFEREGRFTDAWDAFVHARQLAPEDPTFEAAGLWLAPRALSAAEAAAHFQATFAAIGRATAEVCLFYALGEIASLSDDERPTARRERAARVRRAAIEGQARQGTRERVRRYLRAVEFLAEALEASRPLSDDSLYRAGLGDLLAGATRTARQDPVQLLARSVAQTLERAPIAA